MKARKSLISFPDFEAGDVSEMSLQRIARGWRAVCYFGSMNNCQSTSGGKNARRAGFTLIELLTVIAIIGILAAILIPTIGKVRETARFSRGVSNLREWARANILFADENKGWIPHDGGANISATNVDKNVFNPKGVAGPWWNELPPYLGQKTLAAISAARAPLPTFGDNSIFICPNAAANSSASDSTPWLCYAPNYQLSQNNNLMNMRNVKSPSKTALFAETTNFAVGSTGGPFATSNPAYLGSATANGSRWGNKSIVSFFDGSARSFTKPQLAAQGAPSGLTGDNPDGVIWNPR